VKRVLIISPYFPPVNTPDMQRVRMSLPFFEENGWQAEVVAVDPQYTDLPEDKLLLESIPAQVKVHHIKALDKTLTAKLGFAGISYRSYWFYRRKVNEILTMKKFDLIYFSTSQFQVCTLGAYWKKKFKIPYVIDMQDPWHSEYYRNKPKEQQLPKYRLAYHLNKFLEPIAIKQVDGLISVSDDYINDLKNRYPQIKQIPTATITFGAFEPDLNIAVEHQNDFVSPLDPAFKNVVYIGRGGMDMYNAIKPLFETMQKGLVNEPLIFNKIRLFFLGTSYAPSGQGIPTILPLAKQFGLEKFVTEKTDRIGHFHALMILQQANALFIPGSDDPRYTASKIYSYILAHKLILAVFNSQSSAITILNKFGAKYVYSYDGTAGINSKIEGFFKKVVEDDKTEQEYDKKTIKEYSAQTMAKRQCDLFNAITLIPL
jgi:hypothetical protein